MLFGYKKYFNKHIPVSCEYCANCQSENHGSFVCSLKIEMKNGKCRKFKYDPLMREPEVHSKTPKDDYKPKDFAI